MKRELLSAIALLLTFTCFAQTGYIEYNDNCMDQYVYELQDSKNNFWFRIAMHSRELAIQRQANRLLRNRVRRAIVSKTRDSKSDRHCRVRSTAPTKR